jgi:hypothetical protein
VLVTARKGKQNVRDNVFHRARQVPPPCREEPTSFLEYVAQQPRHVQHLLRECDLSENATLKLVSFIYSSRSLLCGTDGGLLNGFGTFGFVWGDSTKVDALRSVRGTSLVLLSSCLRPALECAGASLPLRIYDWLLTIFILFQKRKPPAALTATVRLLWSG